MPIKPVKQVAREAFAQLKKYQSGEIKPIRTGREWLDSIFGGVIPGDIITIGGMSGGGKSYELQRVKNFIMNISNNPQAGNFVWLDFSLEMRVLSLVLRELHEVMKDTGKTKKEILTKPFTEEEQEIARDCYKFLSDGRFFIEERASTANEWEKAVREFLSQHTDKDAVFISIDHIALQLSDGDKKLVIDANIEATNRLKKEFPNAVFFILSQLNRNILTRIKDKDMSAMPNRGDFYQSDTIFQISDYVYVTHNPNRLGINRFLKVNTKIYAYLEDYFTTRDTKNRASFETLGNIFYLVLKMREGDVLFKDIFVESLDVPQEYLDAQEEEVIHETANVPYFIPDKAEFCEPKDKEDEGPGF